MRCPGRKPSPEPGPGDRRNASSGRRGLFLSWLAIFGICALLLGESWFPDKLLLPLAPDDFPAWQAGRAGPERATHPHPNWCMADVMHLMIPGLEVNRQALERGVLPLWDPSQALGLPHIGEVHYAVYYPPAWIPLLLGLQGLVLLAWLHLVVAGGGCLLYLRALGRSSWAALIGALAFALSAWITARLQSYSVAGAAVWLPWILYGLERARPLGYLVAAGAVASSLCAGFPQLTLWLLSLAGGLELVRAARARLRREPALRRLLLSAATLLLGLMLASPQLLPTLDFLTTDSARGEQRLGQVALQGLEAPMFAHLVAPDYYTSTSVPGFQPMGLGVIDQALNPPALNRAEVSLGIGTVGLVLALLGLLFARGWIERFFSVLLLALLALLLWPAGLEAVATVFPPLRYGNPKRVMLLCTLALSVLAAGGVDLLASRRPRLAVIGCGLALGVAGWALILLLKVPDAGTPEAVRVWAGSLIDQFGVQDVGPEDVLGLVPAGDFEKAAFAARRSAGIGLVLASLLAAVILWLFARARGDRDSGPPRSAGTRWLPPVLFSLLTVELLLSAYPMLRALPVESVSSAGTPLGNLREPELVRVIHAAAGETGVPPRIGRVGNQPSDLRPNFPVLYGLQDLQAYAPMLSQRMMELLDAISPGMAMTPSSLGGFLDVSRLALPAVDMLGLDLLLSRQEGTPPGFALAGQVGPIRVLKNTEALPRAWYVRQAERIDDPAKRLRRIAAPDFRPSSLVLLEQPVPATIPVGPLDPLDPLDRAERRKVRVLRYAPGDLELELAPGPAGLVVISETWHSGWSARVSGRETGILRANHALLGIPVEETGRVRIRVLFRPGTHTLGAIMGALALLLLILGAVWLRQK